MLFADSNVSFKVASFHSFIHPSASRRNKTKILEVFRFFQSIYITNAAQNTFVALHNLICLFISFSFFLGGFYLVSCFLRLCSCVEWWWVGGHFLKIVLLHIYGTQTSIKSKNKQNIREPSCWSINQSGASLISIILLGEISRVLSGKLVNLYKPTT